ncbi:nickel pincer cofactor biosynthesis protein LarB [Oleispirillum naphthae]|uniref:nickel pincer cofactor biosynthesis protein LarB n=1 Tax=Oleispirillum naphthae TaxID=2838853 RepID=UPI003082697C
MPGAVMDWQRVERIGLPEAVYAEGKTPQQIQQIVDAAQDEGRRLLITRLDAEKYAALPEAARTVIDYDATSRTAILGAPQGALPIAAAIVTAGLADLPVAAEAERTLAFSGVGATLFCDVGVAGLWRLLDRIDEIRRHRVVIAAAGMEGALFSVLAGLIAAPVIAVPTSVGRGVATGGRVALESALGSCAPGLVVVNIDNGFGAAQAALRILRAPRAAEL